MPNTPRVTNTSNGQRLKLNQARRAVENCTVAWVRVGASVRNLTLAESIAARTEQARMREALPYAEVHGLTFEAPRGKDAATRASLLLAYEASLFVDDVIATGVPA